MNDLELKQLRKIAKAARRLLDTPIWGRGVELSARYRKAIDALETAVKDWEPDNVSMAEQNERDARPDQASATPPRP